MLSTKQYKAVALWIDGKTKKQIAEELKVSERTVFYWFKNTEFLGKLKEENDKFLSALRVKLINHQFNLATKARSEMVQFSATKDLLDRADLINEMIIDVSDEDIEDDGLLEALNGKQEDLWNDED
ncbi:phBC6A51 family helix-turn-helix protein [Lactococcus sp.]|uniref:phBC6A51 family helix-turn-helix protein n=1 Tax=Lactococcus sp. TaxID=44273 RepID=UPI0035B051DC